MPWTSSKATTTCPRATISQSFRGRWTCWNNNTTLNVYKISNLIKKVDLELTTTGKISTATKTETQAPRRSRNTDKADQEASYMSLSDMTINIVHILKETQGMPDRRPLEMLEDRKELMCPSS